MNKEFNSFNFEVIDTNIQGTPDLFVNITCLTFSKKLVEDMGYPPFVRPMIDAGNKAFAIQSCRSTEEKGLKFSKSRLEQMTAVTVSSTVLARAIRTLMRNEWKDNMRYKITGVYFPEAKAMVFDFSIAKEMPAHKVMKADCDAE